MLPLVCYRNKCIEFDGDKVQVNGFKLIYDNVNIPFRSYFPLTKRLKNS